MLRPSTRSLPMLVSLTAVAVAVWPAAASAKTTVRTQTSTKTVSLPGSSAVGNLFDPSQRASMSCRNNERAISPGIVDAPRHLVGQSFGPAAVSAFAVGAAGKVKLRLQVLCAKGGKVSHRRVEGTTFPAANGSTLTTTARASCPGGGIALGAPLSQEFSPGMGAFSSKATTKSKWEVRVEGIPTNYPFQQSVPAYADVACLSKKHVKKVSQASATTDGLLSAPTASVRVACPSGTRALGWGVELRPFASRSSSSVGNGWTVPFVRRAQLAKSAVDFTFELPPGATPSASSGATQTAHVTCGRLV